VSFQFGFEDSVRVVRSEMMREGIPKRKARMLKPREARALLIRDWERRLREAGQDSRRLELASEYKGKGAALEYDSYRDITMFEHVP